MKKITIIGEMFMIKKEAATGKITTTKKDMKRNDMKKKDMKRKDMRKKDMKKNGMKESGMRKSAVTASVNVTRENAMTSDTKRIVTTSKRSFTKDLQEEGEEDMEEAHRTGQGMKSQLVD